MILMFFVIIGTAASLLLKTTGFPAPTVSVTLVQTIYPGAGPDLVSSQVTIPIENAIKSVKGVKRFSSTSANSFSNVVVTFQEEGNLDSYKSALDSAIKTVKLPEGVSAPKYVSPSIGGPELVLSVTGDNLEKLWEKTEAIKTQFAAIPELSTVEEIRKLNRNVVVTLDKDKIAKNSVSTPVIERKISTFNESLPAVTNADLNGVNTAITTSIKGNSLEDLKNLKIGPAGEILSSVANIDIQYNFEGNPTLYSLKNDKNQAKTYQAVVLKVKSTVGTDKNIVSKKINDAIEKVKNNSGGDVTISDRKNVSQNYNEEKTNIITAFTETEGNQEQVNEVIAGLVGSDIPDFGAFSSLGWLLGGIQLVMLVMIALVSWRAAIISALAIPLSFMFSTLYLFIAGESLNTLTLFSLVLVTGLVVDPALVVLEAIQRKLDSGIKGKEAVLEAIRDVGLGVFLAMVTNIIVFAPFGVLSGIFGQIFKYIPLTIVPAIIGSYIVPLVVLSWFGSLLLKKNKNTSDSEKENLWGIAKFLIKLNTNILQGPKVIRIFLISFFFVVPILLTGFIFNSKGVKFVEFASGDNARYFNVTGTFLNKITNQERTQITKDLLIKISSNPDVSSIFPLEDGINFFGYFKDRKLKTKTGDVISEELNTELNKEFGNTASAEKRKFYDLRIYPQSTGGPVSAYQVTMAVKTENVENLKKASLDISNLMQNQICFKNNVVKLDENCSDQDKIITKVDDGFTLKDNNSLNFAIDRDALNKNPLSGFQIGGPLSFLVNRQVQGLFELNGGKAFSKIDINGKSTDIFIKNKEELKPKTTESLKKDLQATLTEGGDLEKLGTLKETNPPLVISRQQGRTTQLVSARILTKYAKDRNIASQVSDLVNKHYTENDFEKTTALGLEKESISIFADGSGSDATKAFSQLGIALILAIILSYIILAVFFNSFLKPLAILYTIPITFLGIFPGLAAFGGGQFGFLEVIGLIILIGIVENVAIFLIDGAKQKEREEGLSIKESIALASGLRFRPVILTKITTLVSLAPLAVFSEFYRSISVVVICGLIASGFTSLVTTPILYVFFCWLSLRFRKAVFYNKILFFPFFVFYIIIWAIQDHLNPVELDISL